MATLESLGFETERRLILFHRDTTMPDNSQLGYVGDPNDITEPTTSGQVLLFNCPAGTQFLDKGQTPMVLWTKRVDTPGGVWIESWTGTESSSGTGNLDGGSASSIYLQVQSVEGGGA